MPFTAKARASGIPASQTSFPNGSQLNPSLTFQGAASSGVYHAGSGNVAVSVNGTQKMIVHSNGVHVNGNLTGNITANLGDTVELLILGDQMMSAASGNTTNPSYSFDVNRSSGIYLDGTSNVSVTSNGTTIATIHPGGVTATHFIGNGSQLTGIIIPMAISNVQITSNTWTVIDDTALDVASGGYFVVNGSEFATGALVSIGGTNATSTSFQSDIQLRVQAPAKSAGTYDVTVTRTGSQTATLPNAINYSSAPTWTTAGATLSPTINSMGFSYQLANTVASDSNVTVSTTTLPPGTTTTLSSNILTLSGNIGNTVTSDTLYSLTVTLNDVELQDTSKTFTLQHIATYYSSLLANEILRVLRISRDSATLNTASDTTTTPTGTYPGGAAYLGGVLLPDGRIFFAPHNAASAQIYNPATDTVTTATGTYAYGASFAGGVLLPNGKVFICPHNSTTARIYDPITDTLTTPTGTYPGSSAFVGCVLMQNGKVFCVPYFSTTGRIYDPATDTLTTPSGTYPGGGAFHGGVLTTDGRIFCVPNSSSTAYIYNPTTDTLTSTGTFTGTNQFVGGVLLPDGRIFLVPSSSTSARIYNPSNNTWTTPSGTYDGGGAFYGGALLPDGRVFCSPFNSTTARVYNPMTDTLTTPTGTYPGSSAFGCCTLAPNGRVYLVPLNSTSGRCFVPGSTVSTPISSTIMLSPYLNKF